MTLTEFLGARLDEREAAAARSKSLRDMLDDPRREVAPDVRDGAEYAWRETAADPARVLREVEAKRKILAAWQDAESKHPGDDAEYAHGYADGLADGLRLAVLAMAATDLGHPDYGPAWALAQA